MDEWLKSEKRPDWVAARLVVAADTNRTDSLPIVDSRIDVDRVRGGKLRRDPLTSVHRLEKLGIVVRAHLAQGGIYFGRNRCHVGDPIINIPAT